MNSAIHIPQSTGHPLASVNPGVHSAGWAVSEVINIDLALNMPVYIQMKLNLQFQVICICWVLVIPGNVAML